MLKPIPVEQTKIKTRRPLRKSLTSVSHYEPHFLKWVGLQLVEFFKRGAVFTIEQINELIEALQRAILRLQKKKQQLLMEEKYRLDKASPKDLKIVKFHRKRIQ